MQKRGLIMLLVALLMGGVAVSLVNSMLKDSTRVATTDQVLPTTPVVVASADIDAGTRLSEMTVKVVDWPKESVPENVFATLDELMGEEPPVVVKEVRKGEAILPYKLAGQGARAGLTIKIPKNMRAITVSVNEVRGVAGFVLPGDRVDVLLTAAADGKKQFTTRTLVQNVQVLGVDQISSEKEEKPKVVNAVTLLVSRQQGKVLTLAQAVGELTLLLRNEADVIVSAESEVDMADLKLVKAEPVQMAEPEPEKPAKVASKPKPRTSRYMNVQVIRGLNSTNYSVKKDDANGAVNGAGKTAP